MNVTHRTETTGKAEVRRETKGRILSVTARLEAMRLMIRMQLDNRAELLETVAQAELQLQAQRRIAERDRSTLPALRVAAEEAERIAGAALAVINAAKQPVDEPAAAGRTRAPRGQYTERARTIFQAAGVEVRMVMYPNYRYDVVGGGETLSVVATRAWRAERDQALAEAVQRAGATA